MKIADEEREVHAGDLVYTPPDTTHSIWPASKNAPLRGLAFAMVYLGPARSITADLSENRRERR